MSDETIHQQWLEVLRELLHRSASKPAPEDAGANSYGKGFSSFDQRSLQPKLAEALSNGRMISQKDWDMSAVGLPRDKADLLLYARQPMQMQLDDLGKVQARLQGLQADLDEAKQDWKSLNAARLDLAGAEGPPPLCPYGQPGIPRDQIPGEIKACGSKARPLKQIVWALEDCKPLTGEQQAALESALAWLNYWNRLEDALRKADAAGAGFDPGLYPAPTTQPAPTTLATIPAGDELSKGLTAPVGRASPLDALTASPKQVDALSGMAALFGAEKLLQRVVPAVPPIPQLRFDDEQKAARASWSAVNKAITNVKSLARPGEASQQQLALLTAWADYWRKLADGIWQAQQRMDKNFDPTQVPAPTGRPDLVASEATALSEIDKAAAAQDRYAKAALAPIEEDMARCLPLLDAPLNNPERKRVSGALKALERVVANTDGHGPQALADHEIRALAELERIVLGWNDRRTRQNLPPSAEAIALADMIQAQHLKLTTRVVDQRLDLPIPGVAGLNEVEKAFVQATWKELRDGTGMIKIPKDPTVDAENPQGNKTVQQAEQFRLETLANFSRLLALPAGRHLVAELKAKGHELRFKAYKEAACQADSSGANGKPTPVQADAQPGGKVPVNRGAGSGSTVMMVRGANDSDIALCTETGSPLHSPAFIAMGHEMVHALHNARGTSRTDMSTDAAIWTDMEELQTIKLGKTSEQSLRDQYGLAAERFGHGHTPSKQAVADAYKDALNAFAALEAMSEQDIEEKLARNHFHGDDALTDSAALALINADPPLPGRLSPGWDPNLLNVEQMRVVIENALDADTFAQLGWSAFDLSPPAGRKQSLLDVVRTQRPSDNSPAYLRYRSLGGDASLKAIATISSQTGYGHRRWKEKHWPSRLEALEVAEEWFQDTVAQHGSQDVSDAAKAKTKLRIKVQRVAAILTGLEEDGQQ